MKTAAAGRMRCEKVVMLGATETGKTSIVQRFLRGTFKESSEATIGAAFFTKNISVDGQTIKLDIWDTGGQERYRSLAPMYYRDARAAIIVFDVTKSDSTSQAEEWVKEFEQSGSDEKLLFGAANKIDLVAQRQITGDQVHEFQYKNQLEEVVETSALSGVGINDLFDRIGRALLRLPPRESADDGFADLGVEEIPLGGIGTNRSNYGSRSNNCNC